MKKKIFTIAVSLVCLVAVLLPVLFYGRMEVDSADAPMVVDKTLITGDGGTGITNKYGLSYTTKYKTSYTVDGVSFTSKTTADFSSPATALDRFGAYYNFGDTSNPQYRYLRLESDVQVGPTMRLSFNSGMVCVLDGYDLEADNGNGTIRTILPPITSDTSNTFADADYDQYGVHPVHKYTGLFHVKSGATLILRNIHFGYVSINDSDALTNNDRYDPDNWPDKGKFLTDNGLITVDAGGTLIVENCELFAYGNTNHHDNTSEATKDASNTSGKLGGFIGALRGKATFTDCLVSGKVGNEKHKFQNGDGTENVAVASFVGKVEDGADLTLKNCVNMAQILGVDPGAAAFVGGVGSGVSNVNIPNETVNGKPRAKVYIENCYNRLLSRTGNSANKDSNLEAEKDFTTLRSSARDQASFVSRIHNGDVTIKNCTNKTSFSLIGGRSGGFVGDLVHGTLTFENCINYGNMHITAPDSADPTRPEKTGGYTDYVGGFVGVLNDGCSAVRFTNCANHGDIKMDGLNPAGISYKPGDTFYVGGRMHYVGGFAANIATFPTESQFVAAGGSRADYATVKQKYANTFTNCYNTGTIEDTATTENYYSTLVLAKENLDNATDGTSSFTINYREYKMCVGGFVGEAKDSIIVMEKCDNQGLVKGGINSSSLPELKEDGNLTTSIELLSMRVGGIIGDVWANTSIKTVEKENGDPTVQNSAAVEGSACTGGIIGYLEGTHPDDAQNYENYGSVKGRLNVGGIIGIISGADFDLSDQYMKNYADVEATVTTAGGVIGRALSLSTTSTAPITCTITSDPNVAHVSGTVTARDFAGGFIGGVMNPQGDNHLSTLVLKNCHTDGGKVTTSSASSGVEASKAGGIIGGTQTAITLINCINKSEVTTHTDDIKAHLGGLVGSVENNSATNITDCVNEGALNGNGMVAGILGCVGGATNITSCKNLGNVSGTYRDVRVGGIIGELYTSEQCVIKDTVNEGNITGPNLVGGFSGFVIARTRVSANLTIQNCTNSGTITVGNATANSYGSYSRGGGGFVGVIWGQSGPVSIDILNSTNSGTVRLVDSSDYHATGMGIGGFVGRTSQSITRLNILDSVNEGEVVSELTRDHAATGDTDYNRYKFGAGGFIGQRIGNISDDSGVTLTGCVNIGKIHNKYELPADGAIDTDTKTNPLTGGTQGVGGIVGVMDIGVSGGTAISDPAKMSTLTACRNYGTIESLSERAAGIVGAMRYQSAIHLNACANYGSVKSSYSASKVGGMIGESAGSTNILIVSCLNMGLIEGTNNVSGFIAESNGLITISSSLNAGYVHGTGDGSAGGFIGYAGGYSARGRITGSANIGYIQNDGTNRLGGLVGGPRIPTLTDCYSYGPVSGATTWGQGYFFGNYDTAASSDFGYQGTAPTVSNLHYLDGITSKSSTETNATNGKLTKDNNATALNTLNSLFGEGKMDLEFISDSVGKVNGMVSVSTPFMRGVQVTEASGDTVKVRFIATVETLNLQRVGFTVTNKKTGESFDASAKYVFTDNGDLSARDPFCGFYMYMLNYWDVPATGTVTFEITPYTMQQNADLSNTYYLGDTYIITITNGALAGFYRKTDSPVQTP